MAQQDKAEPKQAWREVCFKAIARKLDLHAGMSLLSTVFTAFGESQQSISHIDFDMVGRRVYIVTITDILPKSELSDFGLLLSMVVGSVVTCEEVLKRPAPVSGTYFAYQRRG